MTIKELAEVINVSRGTIDRVLHNRGGVSPKTRELVLKAIEEYGYSPNNMGKALAAIKKSYKVGVLAFKGKDGFFATVINGIKNSYEKFKDCRFQLVEKVIDIETPEMVNQELLNFHKDKVDAIIFTALQSPLIRDTVNRLTQEGVLIATVNTDIEGSDRFCFVGHNNYQSGRTAAKLLASMINNKGNILIIAGSREFESHIHRLEGALSFFSTETPNINIADIVEYSESPEKTYYNIFSSLQANPVDAILVLSVYTTETIKALNDLGLAEKVVLGAFGLDSKNTEHLNNNRIIFIIDQLSYLQGQMVMDIVGNYLISNKPLEKDIFYTKTTIIVKENLPDYI